MSHPLTLLLVLLIVPLIWSALIQLIRHMAARKPAIFGDRTEKTVMAIMLLPVATGLVFPVIGPLLTPLNRSHVFYPPVFDEVAQVAVKALPRLAPQGPDLSMLGAQAVLFVYLTGLGFALWRLWQSHNQLARIVSTARPSEDDRYILSSEVSPVAFAWGARRIIVPSALIEALSDNELDLLLAHERAHQRRGDPAYFLLLSLIEALFWFNPLFAQQAHACRLAAELACDAAVTGETPKVRKAYARILMLALKHANRQSTPEITLVPALLSDKEVYKMRLSQILPHTTPARKTHVWLIGIFTLSVPVLMLQMAFAEGRKWPVLNLTAAASAAIPAANGPARLFNTAPADTAVSSPFGIRPNPQTGSPSAHTGVDFDIPTGTPIKTPTSGIVTAASVWGKYGLLVEIDHGNGLRTRFAHLDKALVHWGDKVSEGQMIGLSGNSGQSTHPHLHFEVRQNEKPVDPATVMALK